MISKLNIAKIVVSHLNTLRNDATGKRSVADFLVFYGVPLFLGALIAFTLQRVLTRDAVNFLATVFAIFIGLLLNLLVLVFDGAKKCERAQPTGARVAGSPEVRKLVFEETFANISYSILISVGILVVLFAARLALSYQKELYAALALQCLSVVTYFLAGNFLLTLLMVLKRVHALLAPRS